MMVRSASLLALVAMSGILATAGPGLAQSMQDARQDGRSFATDRAGVAKDIVQDGATTAIVPHFTDTPPQASHSGDPSGLVSAGGALLGGESGSALVLDSMANRPDPPRAEVGTTTAWGMRIDDNPGALVSGYGGTTGEMCYEIPPATWSGGTSEWSCHFGADLNLVDAFCHTDVSHRIETRYLHECSGDGCASAVPSDCVFDGRYCARWEPPATEPVFSPDQPILVEDPPVCVDWRERYVCQGIRGADYQVSYRVHAGSDFTWVGCEGAADTVTAGEAELAGETCTDASPQGRWIDVGGESVFIWLDCWRWTRRYQVADYSVTNSDCAGPPDPACELVGESCIGGYRTNGHCPTWERTYRCPAGVEHSTPTQYVCDGSVYCIDGSCETVNRPANTEFGEAAAAFQAMSDADAQFDPETITVFAGARETCDKAILGLKNCCAQRGFALVGGGCSEQELALKDKVDAGLCHHVGSYCHQRRFFVCSGRRESHCCFASKLARIIQVQGRAQVGRGWGSARDSDCGGLTIAEFARIDLSRIDFTEVYAEFEAMVTLPDELAVAQRIQKQVEDFYAAGGAP